MRPQPLLAIIGTPIGNLEDISKRAVTAITNADIIFAEDTPKALGLLNHLGLKKKVLSCHKDNEKNMLPKIIGEIESGSRCAVISEAGMPCISDPGSLLVRELIEQSIPFEIISGPTALIHGLIASGFCGGAFYFNGFAPHKSSEKKKLFESLKNINSPIIFYESPHRVKDTLKLMLGFFPTPIAVSRELTKMYEETVFIKTEEDIEQIMEKGEFVLTVNNFKEKDTDDGGQGSLDYSKLAADLRKEGFTAQDMVKILKICGMKRNDAYRVANFQEK